MLPLLLTLLATAAAGPPTERATYGSFSTFLFVPTAVSITTEGQWGRFALSGSGFAGYMPDMFFFGGWAPLGVGGAAHGIFGQGTTRFELAGGFDLTLLLDVASYSDEEHQLVPFPTLFVGARVFPKSDPGRLVRVGAEVSVRTFLGLKVSVGRSQRVARAE